MFWLSYIDLLRKIDRILPVNTRSINYLIYFYLEYKVILKLIKCLSLSKNKEESLIYTCFKLRVIKTKSKYIKPFIKALLKYLPSYLIL